MKNFILIQIIILLVGLRFTANAQHDALVRHWDFNGNLADLEDIVHGDMDNITFKEGIEGQGISLSESKTYLEVKAGVDLMKDFTLSFWFKPSNIDINQTLFYQFKQKDGNYNIRNFVRLEIENETFFLKSEKGRFNLKSIPLSVNEWYAISYMYDGTNTKLYLQGELIYSTDEAISFYGNSGGTYRNRLFIGKSHTEKSQLSGVVDDLKIFRQAIKDAEVAAIFKEHRGEEELDNTSQIVDIEPSLTPTVTRPAVSHQMMNDINGENEPNVIMPEDENDKNVIFIENYEVLDPLIVRTTGITVEYYQTKGDDDIQLTIIHNDKSLNGPYDLSKDKQSCKIGLNIGNENSLTFEGFQLERKGKCQIRVNIKSGTKVIASYDIDLYKKNVILPIAYLREKDKKPKNHKTVTVSSRNIKIQVKDNSKVDGDIITIKQEGTVVLNNYSLTDKLKTINIELKEGMNNEFSFIPVDMGTSSGENTALVLILVDDKVIYDFSLRSIDVNRPAHLTIIHEEF